MRRNIRAGGTGYVFDIVASSKRHSTSYAPSVALSPPAANNDKTNISRGPDQSGRTVRDPRWARGMRPGPAKVLGGGTFAACFSTYSGKRGVTGAATIGVALTRINICSLRSSRLARHEALSDLVGGRA